MHDGSAALEAHRVGPFEAPASSRPYGAWAVFFITLPVYLLTMNRTIGFVDRGELAAVAWTFGIAHPTGYPTFTLLGGFVAHLLPLRPVLVLNALAALLVAIGSSLLVPLFERVLAIAAPDVPAGHRRRAASLGGLFTALTATWWQEANGWEVYALHAVLLPLVMLLFLRWIEAEVDEGRDPTGPRTSARAHAAGRWFAVVLGLSFTNHLTTVLLAPALIGYALLRLGGRRLARRSLALVPAFALGLLPYAWLPIRSAMRPRFDWDATRTLMGFIDHLTARQYRGWMFESAATMAAQSSYLAWRLPWDLAWIGLLAAGAGAVWIARRNRALAFLVTLMALVGCLYPIGYEIRDVDAYLMTAVLALGLCASAGILWLGLRMGARWAVVAGGALIALNGAIHAPACDEHRNRLVEDLVRNQLDPLPKRAVLFTSQWDYALAASFYYQEVEGLRRDVLVVSPELLRHSWYLDELEHREPGLLSGVAKEAARFRSAVAGFEQHRAYDPAQIGAAYRALLDGLARRALPDRPVYVTFESSQQFDARWSRVPEGLALRLATDSVYAAPSPAAFTFTPWPGRVDSYVATTSWIYGQAWVMRSNYEARHGHPGESRACLERAARFDPHIDERSVPPLPLDARAIVLQSARFFASLRDTLARPRSG